MHVAYFQKKKKNTCRLVAFSRTLPIDIIYVCIFLKFLIALLTNVFYQNL